MEAHNQQNFLLGAVIGGVIAAAAALFITPASGARIRERVRNSLSRMKRRTTKRRPASSRHSHVLANSARKHKRARAHAVR